MTAPNMVEPDRTAPNMVEPDRTAPDMLTPGGVREMCFEAAIGDAVVYRFEGTGPLAFNLHYHDHEDVYYVVPEHETVAEKGQLLIAAEQTYCLMWTNKTSGRVFIDASVDGAREVQIH